MRASSNILYECSLHNPCRSRSHLGRKLQESLPVPGGHRQGHEGRSGEARVQVDRLYLAEVDLWLDFPERAHPADDASLKRFRIRIHTPQGWTRKAFFSTRGVHTLRGANVSQNGNLKEAGLSCKEDMFCVRVGSKPFAPKSEFRSGFLYPGRHPKFTPQKGRLA